MSVINYNGDVLKSDADIICHQVNCKGVMGAGLAKQIAYQNPVLYKGYKFICSTGDTSSDLLGHVFFTHTDNNPNQIIASIFAQDGYGTNKIQTDYDALNKGFYEVKKYVYDYDLQSVAIPYKIGCGLAGGDWNIVYKMIMDIFKSSLIEVGIYKFGGGKL